MSPEIELRKLLGPERFAVLRSRVDLNPARALESELVLEEVRRTDGSWASLRWKIDDEGWLEIDAKCVDRSRGDDKANDDDQRGAWRQPSDIAFVEVTEPGTHALLEIAGHMRRAAEELIERDHDGWSVVGMPAPSRIVMGRTRRRPAGGVDR